MSGCGITVLAPDWPAPAGVRAAFTLRGGGVSRPPFESLNLGRHTGDDSAAVSENRRRVRQALRLPAEPTWLEQVHGAGVVTLDGAAAAPGGTVADRGPQPPRGDAAVSRSPGRVCAIQVADCMPVLFAARDGTAVGAAHAGWRGLAAGVLEATVRELATVREPAAGTRDDRRPELGAPGATAEGLIAWLGPAIGPDHFEVGDDVREAFLSGDAGAGSAFTRNPRGRWQCDLYALARRRLTALGVREVYGGGWCTYADAARFYSYRRDGRCGRMAALVWIEDSRAAAAPPAGAA